METRVTGKPPQLGQDGFEGFRRRDCRVNGIDTDLHHIQSRVVQISHLFGIQEKAVRDQDDDVVAGPLRFDISDKTDQFGVEERLTAQQIVYPHTEIELVGTLQIPGLQQSPAIRWWLPTTFRCSRYRQPSRAPMPF